MNTKPMLTTGPHSVRFTPELIDFSMSCLTHFIQCAEGKIEQYRVETASNPDGLRPLTEDHTVVVEARREIARAKRAQEALEVLRSEALRIYNWHFEQLAELFRHVRIQMEIDDIRSIYTLRLVLDLFMAMLKAENPMFSEEKFIKYLNEKGDL